MKPEWGSENDGEKLLKVLETGWGRTREAMREDRKGHGGEGGDG